MKTNLFIANRLHSNTNTFHYMLYVYNCVRDMK